MRADAAVDALARFAVALILSTLVVASFTLGSPRRLEAAVVAEAAAVLRAAPVTRTRDREPELDPTPAPEATPAPTSAPVARAASVDVAAPRLAPAALATGTTDGVEARMLALMNASRAGRSLVPLVLDDSVTSVARLHSEVEAQYRYVYHDGPDGTSRSRDAVACGTGWFGENTGKVWNADVDVLHAEFMAEPLLPINHRTNIMDPAFRRAGVGAVQGGDAIYITVVFCR